MIMLGVAEPGVRKRGHAGVGVAARRVWGRIQDAYEQLIRVARVPLDAKQVARAPQSLIAHLFVVSVIGTLWKQLRGIDDSVGVFEIIALVCALHYIVSNRKPLLKPGCVFFRDPVDHCDQLHSRRDGRPVFLPCTL